MPTFWHILCYNTNGVRTYAVELNQVFVLELSGEPTRETQGQFITMFMVLIFKENIKFATVHKVTSSDCPPHNQTMTWLFKISQNSYVMTLASSMKSSSDIAFSLIILTATNRLCLLILASLTTPNCPLPSSRWIRSSFHSTVSVPEPKPAVVGGMWPGGFLNLVIKPTQWKQN